MFIERPARKSDLSKRKLCYGVGVNDSPYKIQCTINGKPTICPFYKRWSGMLERCYSASLHKRRPSYKDCTTVIEWHVFTNFRKWMVQQNWKGRDLDKDLLISGNKIYGPEYCLFIPRDINNLILHELTAGFLSRKITYKDKGKHRVQLSIDKKNINCGRFDTKEEAEIAYLKCKSAHILDKAGDYIDEVKIYKSLIRRSSELLERASKI